MLVSKFLSFHTHQTPLCPPSTCLCRTNLLLASVEVESHRVSVYSAVRPGPTEALSLHTSLALSWTSSKQPRAFTEPLAQRVRYKEYRLGLLAPYTPYTVEVCMLPGMEGALHRSPPVGASATTMGAPPSRPPIEHRAGRVYREVVGSRGVVLN